MFWIRSGLQSLSLSDWLTGPAALEADTVAAGDLDSIRLALFDSVGDQGLRHRQRLSLRIRRAETLEALWHLRSDVMEASALVHGEAEARRRLTAVTRMFDGLLPQARSSPLTRRPRRAGMAEPCR